MRSGWLGGLIPLLATLCAAHGCGDDGDPDSASERVCDPGTVYSCVRGSCNGFQSCSSDGRELSRCTCGTPPPAGRGGSGGASGEDDSGPEPGGNGGRDAGDPPDASGDAAEPMDSGATPSEVCDNGADDDGDGDIDCADSDCGSLECKPDAPADWSGPIALRGAQDGTPSCEGDFAAVAFEAGQTPGGAPASCSACSCTPAASGCAAVVDFVLGTAAACGGATCSTSVNGSCAEITPSCIAGQTSAYLSNQVTPAAGSCSASTQTATKTDVSWSRRVIGCNPTRTPRGGCSDDRLCLPKSLPAAPFEPNLCIWRAGDHPCPVETFTDKRVYWEDVDDTRACSACSCGGPSCSYHWRVYNAADTTCANPILDLESAGQCVQVNPAGNSLRVGASISGGACSASGGTSEGAVSGRDPISVCCQP